MMRRLFDALLWKGLWKFKPIHAILIWLPILATAWGASPYFMYYVVGAPEPGTAPRYQGTLRIEGRLERTRNGWTPPRYIVQTTSGDVEFHCGYRPNRRECHELGYNAKNFGSEKIEVGFDPYWGLDYFKFPNEFAHLSDYVTQTAVSNRRSKFLSLHNRDVYLLAFWLSLYALMVWLAYRNSDPTPKPEVPSEADILKQLSTQASADALDRKSNPSNNH